MTETSHRSLIFFIQPDGQPQAIPRETYVKLVRKEVSVQEYANQKIRVADFYVRLHDGAPCEVENETYSFLYFDDAGQADPHDHKRFSLEENKVFYDAALSSPYEEIGKDPNVQQIRQRLGDDLAWLPSEEERQSLLSCVFAN